jgi:hypothetical protein
MQLEAIFQLNSRHITAKGQVAALDRAGKAMIQQAVNKANRDRQKRMSEAGRCDEIMASLTGKPLFKLLDDIT